MVRIHKLKIKFLCKYAPYSRFANPHGAYKKQILLEVIGCIHDRTLAKVAPVF